MIDLGKTPVYKLEYVCRNNVYKHLVGLESSSDPKRITLRELLGPIENGLPPEYGFFIGPLDNEGRRMS
jgi:hypothetical protein